MSRNKIKWLTIPEKQDYLAAIAYLSLLFDEKQTRLFIAKLKIAVVVQFQAKDIFRASTLALLGMNNSHVKKDLKKIKDGYKLSPLLLTRNAINGKVIIADGYHRLCAVYVLNEDAEIPCIIVS